MQGKGWLKAARPCAVWPEQPVADDAEPPPSWQLHALPHSSSPDWFAPASAASHIDKCG